MSRDEARREVHQALAGLLEEGEMVCAWTVQIDVMGPEGHRYLAHRAGGGVDGTETPTVWTALGMIEASRAVAAEQLLECSEDDVEDEDDPADD